MALKFGSTAISSGYGIKLGSTALKAVKYGSTLVWQKGVDVLSQFAGTWAAIRANYLDVWAAINSQTASNLTVYCKAVGGSSAGVVNAYVGPVDVSDYTKLTVVCSARTANASHITDNEVHARVGLVSAIPASYSDSTSTFINGNAAFLNLDKHVSITGAGTFTLTWTKGELTGNKYVVVQLSSQYYGAVAEPEASMTITSMKFE